MRFATLATLAAVAASQEGPQPPRDTAARWALHFSTGMGAGHKATAQELLLEPPRSLAALALADKAGDPPLTPGFAYAPQQPRACETPEPIDGVEQPEQCSATDASRAASGFGFGWFVQMGGKSRKTYAPMVRYSNDSVVGEEGVGHGDVVVAPSVSEKATSLAKGIRSTTIFAHTRGGGALAVHKPENAPPFLLSADPNHQRAAHAIVQKTLPPNLIWMHAGAISNFQWVRPLLLSQIGRARADLIRGQSDSEHAAALFSSLLVHNRSKVCEDASGALVKGVHTQHGCEGTGRHWSAAEPGTCTRMGATPVDIDTEADCITAGNTWTPGKSGQCIEADGETVYERALEESPEPLTEQTCTKTTNRWLTAAVSKSAGGSAAMQQFSAAELSEALARVVAELDQVDQDPARGELGEKAMSSGIECGPDTAGLNVAVGDGKALVIVRARTCANTLPPPLYLSIGSKWDAKKGVVVPASLESPTPGVVTAVVASEPMTTQLSDVAARWEILAVDEMILIHSESAAVGEDGVISGEEGPGVIERWCLSELCVKEVAISRPEGERPVLHAAAVPAPEGAVDAHRPASAATYHLDSGQRETGSLTGDGADDWKPPAAAGADGEAGGGGALTGSGKLGGDEDDWKPPGAGVEAGGGGSLSGGVGVAGADDWQPPGSGGGAKTVPGASAGGGVLKGSLTSRPAAAAAAVPPPSPLSAGGGGGGGGGGMLSSLQAEEAVALSGMGLPGGGGVRQPRRLDSAPVPPPPPVPRTPNPMDDEKLWQQEEEDRRGKASKREQAERDRHKATQDRLARDRAFRVEEQERQEDNRVKEQEAWDKAAQRRRERTAAETGEELPPPPPPPPGRGPRGGGGGGGAGAAGAGAGAGMTMRGWLGAARLDSYHKDFQVHPYLTSTNNTTHPYPAPLPSSGVRARL